MTDTRSPFDLLIAETVAAHPHDGYVDYLSLDIDEQTALALAWLRSLPPQQRGEALGNTANHDALVEHLIRVGEADTYSAIDRACRLYDTFFDQWLDDLRHYAAGEIQQHLTVASEMRTEEQAE